jgi:hypothetical protein
MNPHTGILHFKWTFDNPAITVVQADPQIVATNDSLQELIQHPNPGITIEPPPTLHATLTGHYLKINATNGHCIYRINQYDPTNDTYQLEWPD